MIMIGLETDKRYDYRIGGAPCGFSLITPTILLYWNIVFSRLYYCSRLFSSFSLLITEWEWHRFSKVDGQSLLVAAMQATLICYTVLLHFLANSNCKLKWEPILFTWLPVIADFDCMYFFHMSHTDTQVNILYGEKLYVLDGISGNSICSDLVSMF